ncbi:hypothetical protein BACCIP111899_01594 [Bacillus rhizoplanae]|uniref:Uncharacterized protein n=1 Tax=Bacillus rhizoplanae TaxID=2880966 RepID=A0ABM8Y9I1_9BACI|nr:hypothetical protein [Bacillus rhizoplanae]CAG9612418.1 hypothetical protein BACCIP111899_01594 [Bacillus rhizoplanae]
MEELTFLNSCQRKKLQEAYELIESVYKQLTYDHAEHAITGTALDALKRAIDYQKNFE